MQLERYVDKDRKACQRLAHAYSILFNIPATGLRFFTVCGSAGRLDMAYFRFTDKLKDIIVPTHGIAAITYISIICYLLFILILIFLFAGNELKESRYKSEKR